MLECLSKDSKIQMRLNIIRHRQKLLQYLENTNDTFLKPKIKLVSNDIEKSYFNLNVKPKISSEIKLVSNDIEKSNLNQNVQPNIASKIKLVSNDIEKSSLNHNVQPNIATSTESQTPERPSTIKVTNYKNKSAIRVKTYEPVIITKPNILDVLRDNNIKKYKTRSSITVNRLPPNLKVNIIKEPLTNVQLRLKPLSKIQLKPKPVPNIEIKDPEPPPVIVKKLKEQLIEELFDSSSSEEIDDNISVGNDDDWNEIYQTHNSSDVDENDSRNAHLIEADISKEEYISDSADSDNPVLAINYPTSKRRYTKKKKISTEPQFQIDDKHRFRKPQDRSLHNAKERACRERIAKKFAILRKSCSYLNTNRRVPSKHSILLAAKKECDLLKHFEKKMLAEKKVWQKANEILKNRIAEFYSRL